MTYRHRLALTILLAAHVPVALADANEALYEAVAPPDASFVRLINMGASPTSLSIRGFEKQHLVGTGQVGTYVFLDAGSHTVTVDDQPITLELDKREAVTLVFDGGQPRVVEDQVPSNAQKALIGFYNLTGETAALKTADGKVTVIDAVAPGSVGFREVNEVRIGFAAFAGEQALAAYEPSLLRKGRSYSYVIMNTADSPRAYVTANEVQGPE